MTSLTSLFVAVGHEVGRDLSDHQDPSLHWPNTYRPPRRAWWRRMMIHGQRLGRVRISSWWIKRMQKSRTWYATLRVSPFLQMKMGLLILWVSISEDVLLLPSRAHEDTFDGFAPLLQGTVMMLHLQKMMNQLIVLLAKMSSPYQLNNQTDLFLPQPQKIRL